jgi:predicted enzyme related to lactoylglutathione lyase
MGQVTFGGLQAILITSENPEKTVNFYRDVAGLHIEEEKHGGPHHWAAETNGVHFAIHNAKGFSDGTFPANRASNLTHMYFNVSNMADFLTHLQKLGIEKVKEVEDLGFIEIVEVRDPDGRVVQFGANKSK